MVKEICHDPFILSKASVPASKEDVGTAEDLLDTLKANREKCVGMAANMIGINKCIIAFQGETGYMIMMNPKIIKCSEPYTAEEGCLSLSGTRKAKRFKSIKVQYYTVDFKIKIATFKNFTAQIIQHEIDHCDGILI